MKYVSAKRFFNRTARAEGQRIREWDEGRERLVITPDAEELAEEAAALFMSRAEEAIAGHGRFDVLLSGGSTPKRMFEILADRTRAGEGPQWDKIHLFWGDERMVPPDHPESNYGMTFNALISKVPIPPGNVHRIQGELPDPAAAAARYEDVLRKHFGHEAKYPRFDLVFLGLGPEGHVASLFPGSTEEFAGPEWVLAPWIEKLGKHRVSVSLGTLNAAKEVAFLVSGDSKAEILKRIFSPTEHKALLPAQRVHPLDGRLLWLADRVAARLISD